MGTGTKSRPKKKVARKRRVTKPEPVGKPVGTLDMAQGAMAGKNPKRIASELKRVRRDCGSLEPEHVWKWAKDHPGSVLHGCYEWDLRKAAVRTWIEISRQIIASVRVWIETAEDQTASVRMYHSVRPAGGRGGKASRREYVPLDEVLGSPEYVKQVQTRFREEWQAMEDRYARFDSVLARFFADGNTRLDTLGVPAPKKRRAKLSRR